MARTVTTKIYLRNDVSATWVSKNPVLGKGEAGVEVDTGLVKFGDGSTHWNELKYAGYTKQSQLTNDDYTVKDSEYSSVKAKANAAIATVKVNGTALTPASNAVNITVATGSSAGSLAVNGTDIVVKGFSDLSTTVNGKANKATTLAGYNIGDAYTKKETDSAIASAVAAVFKYKGTIATTEELPSSGLTIGDVYFVSADSSEYAWNGKVWEELGPVIDLSHFITTITIAGLTLNSSTGTITADQLKTALGLGAAAYLGVVKTGGTAPTNTDSALPTYGEVSKMVNEVDAKFNGPFIFDCGDSSTEVTQ